MENFLGKLSSYNIFTNLLPGVLFVALAEFFTSYSFEQENVVLAAFTYYFIGLIINRIGSLVVEPLAKATKFVRFAPYNDFVAACQKDQKIEILSETNNMYRSFCGLVLSLIIVRYFPVIPGGETYLPEIALAGLLLLFLISYRKQTTYVAKRVKSHVS